MADDRERAREHERERRRLAGDADIGGYDSVGNAFMPENPAPGDIDALYGVAGNGLPLDQLFVGVDADAAEEGISVMNAALALGENPRTVVTDLMNVMNIEQARALTIARTEMLGAWRDAQAINYRANSDVLDGWIWSSSLGGACIACVMMDGTVHPLDEDMDSHPNCACIMVPLTKSWDDLLGDIEGFDTDLLHALGPETDYLNEGYEDGQDWFLAQSEATQIEVLGPAKFEAWSSGDVDLLDFVGQRDAGAWGNEIYERSLKEIGLDANAYLGRTTLSETENVAFSVASAGSADGNAASIAASIAAYDLTAEDRAFVDAIKAQIPEGGITTADDAIALGQQIHERITTDLTDLRSWVDEFASIKQRGGVGLTDAETAWVRGTPEANAAHGGFSVSKIEGGYRDAYQAQVRAYLSEVRELGGEVNLATDAARYNELIAERIESAARYIPSDWLRASNDLGSITPVASRTAGIGGSLTPKYNGKALLAIFNDGTVSRRFLSAGESTALHEMMHRMEQTAPIFTDIERLFYEMRTAGEEAVPLTNGIEWTTKLDQWLDEYLGREPFGLNRPPITLSDGSTVNELNTYELLSMGAEMILAPGVTANDFLLLQDEQYAAFILGVFFGVHV